MNNYWISMKKCLNLQMSLYMGKVQKFIENFLGTHWITRYGFKGLNTVVLKFKSLNREHMQQT